MRRTQLVPCIFQIYPSSSHRCDNVAHHAQMTDKSYKKTALGEADTSQSLDRNLCHADCTPARALQGAGTSNIQVISENKALILMMPKSFAFYTLDLCACFLALIVAQAFNFQLHGFQLIMYLLGPKHNKCWCSLQLHCDLYSLN